MCSLPLKSLLPLSTTQPHLQAVTDLLYIIINDFAFSSLSYKWNHAVWTLFKGKEQGHSGFFHLVLLFWDSSMLLSDQKVIPFHYLIVFHCVARPHQLTDSSFISSLGLLQIILLWTISRCVHRHMFSFLSVIYLGV